MTFRVWFFPIAQVDTEQGFYREHYDDDRRETVNYRVGHPFAAATSERRHSDPHRGRDHPMDRIPVHSDPHGGPDPGVGHRRHNLHLRVVVEVRSNSEPLVITGDVYLYI